MNLVSSDAENQTIVIQHEGKHKYCRLDFTTVLPPPDHLAKQITQGFDLYKCNLETKECQKNQTLAQTYQLPQMHICTQHTQAEIDDFQDGLKDIIKEYGESSHLPIRNVYNSATKTTDKVIIPLPRDFEFKKKIVILADDLKGLFLAYRLNDVINGYLSEGANPIPIVVVDTSVEEELTMISIHQVQHLLDIMLARYPLSKSGLNLISSPLTQPLTQRSEQTGGSLIDLFNQENSHKVGHLPTALWKVLLEDRGKVNIKLSSKKHVNLERYELKIGGIDYATNLFCKNQILEGGIYPDSDRDYRHTSTEGEYYFHPLSQDNWFQIVKMYERDHTLFEKKDPFTVGTLYFQPHPTREEWITIDMATLEWRRYLQAHADTIWSDPNDLGMVAIPTYLLLQPYLLRKLLLSKFQTLSSSDLGREQWTTNIFHLTSSPLEGQNSLYTYLHKSGKGLHLVCDRTKRLKVNDYVTKHQELFLNPEYVIDLRSRGNATLTEMLSPRWDSLGEPVSFLRLTYQHSLSKKASAGAGSTSKSPWDYSRIPWGDLYLDSPTVKTPTSTQMKFSHQVRILPIHDPVKKMAIMQIWIMLSPEEATLLSGSSPSHEMTLSDPSKYPEVIQPILDRLTQARPDLLLDRYRPALHQITHEQKTQHCLKSEIAKTIEGRTWIASGSAVAQTHPWSCLQGELEFQWLEDLAIGLWTRLSPFSEARPPEEDLVTELNRKYQQYFSPGSRFRTINDTWNRLSRIPELPITVPSADRIPLLQLHYQKLPLEQIQKGWPSGEEIVADKSKAIEDAATGIREIIIRDEYTLEDMNQLPQHLFKIYLLACNEGTKTCSYEEMREYFQKNNRLIEFTFKLVSPEQLGKTALKYIKTISNQYAMTSSVTVSEMGEIGEMNVSNREWFHRGEDLMKTLKKKSINDSHRRKEQESDPLFIQSKVIPSHSKLLVIGDLHSNLGSLLMIWREWMNRGILSEGLKLHPEYRLIFLGDLVDRGAKSCEILYLVWKMYLANPDQVTIINGNHEDMIGFWGKRNHGGFHRELWEQLDFSTWPEFSDMKKALFEWYQKDLWPYRMGMLVSEKEDTMADIIHDDVFPELRQTLINLIRHALWYLPSALYLRWEDHTKWIHFSHGVVHRAPGFHEEVEKIYGSRGVSSKEEWESIWTEILPNHLFQPHHWLTRHFNDSQSLAYLKLKLKSDGVDSGFKWADLGTGMANHTNKPRFILQPPILKQYLGDKIHLVIRGHQDHQILTLLTQQEQAENLSVSSYDDYRKLGLRNISRMEEYFTKEPEESKSESIELGPFQDDAWLIPETSRVSERLPILVGRPDSLKPVSALGVTLSTATYNQLKGSFYGYLEITNQEIKPPKDGEGSTGLHGGSSLFNWTPSSRPNIQFLS